MNGIVIRDDEAFEKALRRFSKTCERAGILSDIKKYRHYEKPSEERKRIMRAYGAEIQFTNPLEGSDGAIRAVRALYDSDPDRYFYPDQYSNDSNWRAHFDTTGPEIIEQTGTTAQLHFPSHS